MDIFYLKTKTSVGQFLVVFQPILSLSNFLFTELSLWEPRKSANDSTRLIGKISTNTMQSFYSINPYLGD